jgi:hypothetical protein
LTKTDRSKLIPNLDYLKRELPFVSEYKREVDWKVYQIQRSKRLEIERWVESLINATLDLNVALKRQLGMLPNLYQAGLLHVL